MHGTFRWRHCPARPDAANAFRAFGDVLVIDVDCGHADLWDKAEATDWWAYVVGQERVHLSDVWRGGG